MRVITALELRKKLGQILDAASAGERIVVERDHRPLAVLISYDEAVRMLDEDRGARRARQLAALKALDEFADRMARDHPETIDRPDAATLIRLERSRDDPQEPRGQASAGRDRRSC